MIEIKCKKDIDILKDNKNIPEELIRHISEEFVVLKSWCDEDDQDSIEEFHTDNYGYGYITILEGNETNEEIQKLGLSEGLEGIFPEDAVNYQFGADKYTRIIVIYNDSYSMSIWLKNSNLFDSFERKAEISGVTSGISDCQNIEIF